MFHIAFYIFIDIHAHVGQTFPTPPVRWSAASSGTL